MPGSQKTQRPGVCKGRNHWVLGSWCHKPLGAGKSDCLQVSPPHPERESCLCVPQDGDRPGSHDITHPGPSPAVSKVLESFAESDLSYRDSGIQLMGGWGSVKEISQDLYPGLTHIREKPPCPQSSWAKL